MQIASAQACRKYAVRYTNEQLQVRHPHSGYVQPARGLWRAGESRREVAWDEGGWPCQVSGPWRRQKEPDPNGQILTSLPGLQSRLLWATQMWACRLASAGSSSLIRLPGASQSNETNAPLHCNELQLPPTQHRMQHRKAL